MTTQGRPVLIVITVEDNGEARIEIPHNRNQQRDANAAASFTDRLSKAMGEVKERHIGDHHHHDHGHDHDHDHVHH